MYTTQHTERLLARLVAEPTGPLSHDYRVLDEGHEIARIDRGLIRERATFLLEGSTFRIRRHGFLRPAFLLEKDGRTIARAHKPRTFARAYELTLADRRLALEPISWLGRGWTLRQGALEIGRIVPVAVFRRAADITLPADMPRAIQLFVISLVVSLWKQSSSTSR